MTGDQRHREPGPIEDYALLSDLRTAALVGKDGSIDWLCLPRFDAPSCFCRLLGTDRDGHWQIAPTAPVREVRRRYRDNSLVLETDFHTDDGVLRLVDCMRPHEAADHRAQPCLVRTVQGISGEVDVKLRWVVRFAYGESVPWVRRVRETGSATDEFILAIAGPHTAVLRGDVLPQRSSTSGRTSWSRGAGGRATVLDPAVVPGRGRPARARDRSGRSTRPTVLAGVDTKSATADRTRPR
ncbi:trehalase-like domain-containing protein [Saccharopolyspora hordei]|uniref:trehalase-like domain-containing protein n=1 Tax=Saccharopolyspora hordei TaxID=1838 RepID=UPI0031EEEF2A